jgi:hypothetical protein
LADLTKQNKNQQNQDQITNAADDTSNGAQKFSDYTPQQAADFLTKANNTGQELTQSQQLALLGPLLDASKIPGLLTPDQINQVKSFGQNVPTDLSNTGLTLDQKATLSALLNPAPTPTPATLDQLNQNRTTLGAAPLTQQQLANQKDCLACPPGPPANNNSSTGPNSEIGGQNQNLFNLGSQPIQQRVQQGTLGRP